MKTPKEFYSELGVKGLDERKKTTYTKKELGYLKRILNKKQKILDVGCGYGRFTIPLAKQGYNIEGIDITPLLIRKAKEMSNKEKINISFKVGDMKKLPYKKESFDSIICMWSVFTELNKELDQVKSIKEMLRVLKKGGFAFIEMSKPTKKKSYKDEKIGDEFKIKGKIAVGKIANIEKVPSYVHNKKTLTKLMKKIKIKKFKVFIDEFGGRNRLLLIFWKDNIHTIT